jgi:23S rRNA (adenine2030-N6)-methyltransferase
LKYRHSFHAGNFADVHKHVTLLALLTALKRKDKGFAYFETHAGRGAYDLSNPSAETAAGIGRFTAAQFHAEELQAYAALLAEYRAHRNNPRAYPGSPVIAARELRPQDRAVLSELVPGEARALEQALDGNPQVRVERGDGLERLRAWLPPRERRGLIFIDPPYEETRQDFERVTTAVAESLRRFRTGVIAAWYPIKDERETSAWHAAFVRSIDCETLASELWLYPRDSRVALNGSGLLIVNPPYLLANRMKIWLPQLQSQLDIGRAGGTSVHLLARAPPDRV